ncbi:hypothetical protein E4T56_gene16004 [Termitomyces sp. T112]|nr:hypothetical protein E4T56_gene16004 [Termitomyces sp. T112]
MTRPLDPCTSSSNPPIPQKTPNTPPNFRPCPAPILVSPDTTPANSDASPANSDSPLANFDTFPAATDTYPGSPEPRESPPLFLIFATHHQLNTLVPPTHSRVSRQPRGNLRSQMIPTTYQRGLTLDRNRHPPSPSSSAKPRRHNQRTPKFSDMTLSGRCAQVFTNINDLTNSTITIMNPDTLSPVDSAVTSAQQIKGPRHPRPDLNNPRTRPRHPRASRQSGKERIRTLPPKNTTPRLTRRTTAPHSRQGTTPDCTTISPPSPTQSGTPDNEDPGCQTSPHVTPEPKLHPQTLPPPTKEPPA